METSTDEEPWLQAKTGENHIIILLEYD